MKLRKTNPSGAMAIPRAARLMALIVPVLLMCQVSWATTNATITKISPTVASANGGTVITITGTNFMTGATVYFGENSATKVVFVNKTTLRATAPASTGNAEGTVTISVTDPDGLTGMLSEGLLYDLPPSLTAVTPASGLTGGGYTVTLTGEYFRCGSSCPGGPVVLFGTTPATSVIFNSNTTLTVTVPAHAAGTVNVTETNTDGLQTVLKNGFTFSPVTVTQVSPAIGPLGGKNTVTITGNGFTSGSTVTFGSGTTAVTVASTFVSPTTLTAVAPAHAGGEVEVTVKNSGGTGSLAKAYQYSGAPIISSLSPSSGPVAGGTTVTINGFNLAQISSVTFGGTAVTPLKSPPETTTSLTVVTPAFPGGANPVNVVTKAPALSYTATGAFTYEALSILTMGLDDGYPTIPYNNTLNVSGGTAPYTWSITSGNLPTGLALSPAGVLSGTPNPAYGSYNIGFQVQDSSSPANVASTSLSFNILFGFTTETIPATYFGMILYNQANWPSVPIGALGKGLATDWPFLEPTQGSYNWTALDQYVEQAQSHLVPGSSTTPLTLYWSNANVPGWAAQDPTGTSSNGQPNCSTYSGTVIIACTSAVTNLQYITDFWTALVNRYYGVIQIYELWSEPNVPNVYTGSLADLAAMTSAAFNAIQQNNPTATILSPSPTAAPFLLSYLNTPGAPLGFNAVAIHGYPNVPQDDAPEALVGFKTVNVKLSMLQAQGVGVKPIWDTEGSWGEMPPNGTAITDPNLQAGFVSRSLLLHWSVGIQNMYWYGWDVPNWGTLWYQNTGINPAGTSYGVTEGWMVGASMPTPCSANGGTTFAAVYTCQLLRSGGYSALAVWDTTQTCTPCTYSNYTPATQYVQYRTVSGTVVSITPGQTIQIGAQPILLENMDAAGSTTTPPPPPASNATFTYEGLSNDFANMATENPSSPEVPPSPNQAPTGTPVAGQVALSNLLVMPGLSAPTTGTATVDSDATLAVGTTQIMQWADFRLQVYNKTATPLLNAMPGNVLWSSTLMDGTSNPCAAAVSADGIVQFDKLASVWVLAMRTGNNQECIGISQSSDATQQYYQYLFSYVDPNNPTYQMDYPHIGVWPDAYYLTFDMLDPSNDYAPQYAVACALNRPSMVFGRPNAGAVCFTTAYSNNTGFFHLIPSDLDSTALPPTGSPNYIFTFAKPASSTAYHLYGYQFHVNFSTPSESTFTGPVQIDTNAFSGFVPACAAGGDNCVPQPPAPAGMTDYDLDSLGGYLMYRAAYRNFGSYESLLLSQAVQTGKGTGVQYPVGVRWYELRNLQAGPTIYQNGFLQAANSSTTPDTFNRWMSSAAEDGMGNIAVGYSISGAGPTAYYSGYPGLAINGRVPSDPLGTFETEKIVFPGVSVEVPTPPLHTGRWGSVATLAIDPVDQCTFWFTGQYEPTPGVLWSTELVSFTMPGCPQ